MTEGRRKAAKCVCVTDRTRQLGVTQVHSFLQRVVLKKKKEINKRKSLAFDGFLANHRSGFGRREVQEIDNRYQGRAYTRA